jgi:hypothetical protein
VSSVVNLRTSANASNLSIVVRADVQQENLGKPRLFNAPTAIIRSRIGAMLRPATRRAACRRTKPTARRAGFPVYGENT